MGFNLQNTQNSACSCGNYHLDVICGTGNDDRDGEGGGDGGGGDGCDDDDGDHDDQWLNLMSFEEVLKSESQKSFIAGRDTH